MVPVLFTFYIHGVLKLKNNSGAKRLITFQVYHYHKRKVHFDPMRSYTREKSSPLNLFNFLFPFSIIFLLFTVTLSFTFLHLSRSTVVLTQGERTPTQYPLYRRMGLCNHTLSSSRKCPNLKGSFSRPYPILTNMSS